MSCSFYFSGSDDVDSRLDTGTMPGFIRPILSAPLFVLIGPADSIPCCSFRTTDGIESFCLNDSSFNHFFSCISLLVS